MKLGILVVYLVHRGNEKLLDLHVESIRKHTNVAFQIYGASNRLDPVLKQKLMSFPEVRLPALPSTSLRYSFEHSFYLDRLAQIAIKDGCDHLAVLHVDSFPIQTGWAKTLADRLKGNFVLAAIPRHETADAKPTTACMLFKASFYNQYDPGFLIPKKDRSTRICRLYEKRANLINESGEGFGLKLFENNLKWYPLKKVGGGENWFGAIYDGMIYHLGAAAQPEKSHPTAKPAPLAVKMRRSLWEMMPSGLYARLAGLILQTPARLLFPAVLTNKAAFENERDRLYSNPEAYFQSLVKNMAAHQTKARLRSCVTQRMDAGGDPKETVRA